MRIINKLIIVAIIFFLTIPLVYAFPTIPHRFMGYVFDQDGNLVSDGMNISAELNGVFYNTTVKNGRYGYPDDTEKFELTGSQSDIGLSIYFYINGTLVEQSTVYNPGFTNVNNSPNFNLSYDSSIPIISDVSVSSVTYNSAVITWNTNKFTTSVVNYGTTTSLSDTNIDSTYTREHQISLSGLESDTTYYFEIVSYDYIENMVVDNNSGEFYNFSTEQFTQNGGDGDADGENDDTGFENNDTNSPPVANAGGPYFAKIGDNLSFDASESEDSDGFIANYKWNFGDGSGNIITDELSISYSYDETGNYTVILTVTDNDGDTDTTVTYANISSNDSDGDGWSDQAEDFYGYDSKNSSSYPIDSDGDGVPDDWDSDNDNDGLTNQEEELINSNPYEYSNTLRILNEFGLFILVDIDGDDIFDIFYDRSSGIYTDLFKSEENIWLIDSDGDGVYDYQYNELKEEINNYSLEKYKNNKGFSFELIIIVIIALIFLVLLFVVFKKKK